MDRRFAADLEEVRAALQRRDLEDPALRFACPPAEPGRALLPWAGAVRIAGLARFWERGPTTLAAATRTMVQSLAADGREWAFALQGGPDELRVLVSVRGRDAATPVRAQFPRAALAEAEIVPGAHLPHAVLFAGPPRVPDPAAGERLEPLIRAMAGTPWLYVVQARPIGPGDVRDAIGRFEVRRSSLERLTHLRTGSAGAGAATLKALIAAIDGEIARLGAADRTGLWDARAWLFAASGTALEQGAAALRAALSGPAAADLVEPLRLLPCRPGTPGAAQSVALSPLTSADLALLVQPPQEAQTGYAIVEDPVFAPPPPPGPDAARSIPIGRDAARGSEIRLGPQDLTEHLLVAGLPGTGKTTTCHNLLAALDRLGIPFLVIEPAKSEYRRLAADPGLRRSPLVLTVGDETVAPLRLNPFEVPDGIRVQAHAGQVKTLMRSAFVLYAPMPEVLGQAIDAVYADRGWDLAADRNDRAGGERPPGSFPTLGDLIAKVPEIVRASDYSDQVRRDIESALVVRLDALRAPGGIGPMLDTRISLPVETLFETPCILEFAGVTDDQERAFLIGLILLRLNEHNETWLARGGGGALRHVTLVEEAHRVLANAAPGPGSELAANPQGEVVKLFSNLMKEMRSSGAGMVIVEQSPSSLAPAAQDLTGSTITHRLKSDTDRRAIASKLGLTEVQARALGELARGEALVHCASDAGVTRVRTNGPRPSATLVVRDADVRDRARDAGLEPGVEPRSLLPGALRRAVDRPPLALSRGFVRLFNAMRTRVPGELDLSPERLGDALLSFVQAGRAQARGFDETAAMALFMVCLERELDRRGAAAEWPFAAVEEMIRLGNRAFLALMADADEALDAVGDFAMQLDAGHRWLVEHGRPFAGCDACPHACAHRFDVARVGLGGADTAAALRAGDAEAFAGIALDAAACAYPDGDPAQLIGAAYCFAASCLAEGGEPESSQRRWMRAIGDRVSGADPARLGAGPDTLFGPADDRVEP